jgi:hypothetical protein
MMGLDEGTAGTVVVGAGIDAARANDFDAGEATVVGVPRPAVAPGTVVDVIVVVGAVVRGDRTSVDFDRRASEPEIRDTAMPEQATPRVTTSATRPVRVTIP